GTTMSGASQKKAVRPARLHWVGWLTIRTVSQMNRAPYTMPRTGSSISMLGLQPARVKGMRAASLENVAGYAEHVAAQDLLDVVICKTALHQPDSKQRPVRPGEAVTGLGRRDECFGRPQGFPPRPRFRTRRNFLVFCLGVLRRVGNISADGHMVASKLPDGMFDVVE